MSELRVRSIAGKDDLPVASPNGIVIGTAAAGGVNHIGNPGRAGFGAGVCPGPLPAGMLPLLGYADPLSDNYGNYVFSDGSQMVWVGESGSGKSSSSMALLGLLPANAKVSGSVKLLGRELRGIPQGSCARCAATRSP